MSKKKKLLNKVLSNPTDILYKDFIALLKYFEFRLDRQKGSHEIWYSKEKIQFNIQPSRNGKAKVYQVKQFIKYYNRYYEKQV